MKNVNEFYFANTEAETVKIKKVASAEASCSNSYKQFPSQ